jgi:TetR/AcrR family transcriptional repressor of nem operon
MSRRDEILEFANELIQNVGYKGFSYADLSKQLGITKASIHHHFPSKEDLGIAYCEKKLQALRDFRETLKAMPDYTDQLQAYIGIFKGCQSQKMCGINAMLSDIGDMPDSLIGHIRKVTELELEILTEILTGGRSLGVFDFAIAPYDQAIMIASSLKGALMLSRIKKDDSFTRLCAALMRSLEKIPAQT